MSSHDCRVSGTITLNEGVTEEDVRKALASFLTAAGSDFDDEVDEGNVEIDGCDLTLSLDFHGYGGYQNDDVDELIENLSKICDGPDWVEVFDFDTGDTDAACTPRFIGTPENQLLAKVQYGIQQMADWVAPVIGKEAFKSLEEMILSFPRSLSNT